MTNVQQTNLPLLAEGASYRLEIMSAERVVKATLLRIVDDNPLGRGFSFQLAKRRLFVFERDLTPGPTGYLIAAV